MNIIDLFSLINYLMMVFHLHLDKVIHLMIYEYFCNHDLFSTIFKCQCMIYPYDLPFIIAPII